MLLDSILVFSQNTNMFAVVTTGLNLRQFELKNETQVWKSGQFHYKSKMKMWYICKDSFLCSIVSVCLNGWVVNIDLSTFMLSDKN